MKLLIRYCALGIGWIALPWIFWLSVIKLQEQPSLPRSEDGAALAHREELRNRRLNREPENEIYFKGFPTIYVVTPTYVRPTQKADLTRVAQALLHVKRLHWIVIEDSKWKTKVVSHFLLVSGLAFTHLHIQTPPGYKNIKRKTFKPRGTVQRNLGIEWLRKNLTAEDRGVVYFADDDNTYDIRLFDEMRDTKGVSCWPAGLHGGILHGGPICKDGKVIDFRAFWRKDRPFAMDMCSFAVNVKLFLENPKAKFDLDAEGGFQESSLLKKITTVEQLEPKASNCTQVLVWHTRTESPDLSFELKLRTKLREKYNSSFKISDL